MSRIVRRLALVLIAVFGGTLLLSTAAQAQSQVSLLTLETDQSPLNLSNHFGVPNEAGVNQAGDFAFIGAGGSALFLRRAGTSTTTRLLQFGDPVPGFAGATLVDFIPGGGFNSSAHILFGVDFSVSPPDGRLHRAILIYDGISPYRTVASSDDVAANSGSQKFGPSLSFVANGESLNDRDDVLFGTTFEPFAGSATAPNQNTFYIAPAGGTPVRVVGLGDAVPGVSGTFTSFGGSTSQINALGQFLFSGSNSSTPAINGLFLGSASGVTKVVATGDSKTVGGTAFSPTAGFGGNSGELNNSGQVAFVDPVSATSTVATVWLYSAGVITNTYPGSTGTSISLRGLSDPGEAVGTFTSTGAQSLVRIHSTGQIVDTIASLGQAAPGVSGATFTSFSNLSTDNNDRAIFDAALSTGGYAVYQQTGNGPSLLVPVALEGQSASLPGGGTLNLGGISTGLIEMALDNGSTVFSAAISGGTANFAVFLGTPGNLQVLMSTADTLPAGARVRLSLPALGNTSVAFAANSTGGQTAIFAKNLNNSGMTTRIVSEGDAIGGFSIVQMATPTGVKPFYVNQSGQVVFPAVLTGNMQAILVSDSTGTLNKVVATGDTAPVTGTTFASLDFSSNSTELSPINDSGDVGFYATLSTGVSGIFLYTPGVGLAKIAATGDAVPEGGGGIFTNLSSNSCTPCSLGVNNVGQVAFGALKSNGMGLYVGSASGSPQKVVASQDTRPGIGGIFGTLDPISGFNNNSGQLVFNPLIGGGVFEGTAGGTPTAVALDGATNPGAGGGTLATSTPAFGTNSYFSTTNAAIEPLGDVVFRSRVTGGTADSGYFRVLQTGGSPGPLQAAVLQGQTVPGAGTLGTLFPSFLTNSFFSISGDGGGDFTFTNSFMNTSGTMVGQFLSTADGAVQKLMAPGDTVSGTGGGVYSTGTAFSQNGGGRADLLDVLTAGGTASQAIVFAIWDHGTVATSTALISALNPSGIGLPAVFTATVTSSQGPPPAGDIVIFLDNGVAMGVSNTDGTGQAAFVTASLSAGSHLITAEYFPNSFNELLASSTSNVVTQVVSNSTSTLLFSMQNPSVSAQSVLFEAFVYSLTGGSPTGSVTFLDNGTSIGTSALSGGLVTFTTSSLSVGTHPITAQYSGDSVFSASTSNLVPQIVQGTSIRPSATALASTVNPSFAGQSITFIAPVAGSAGGTPTGNVAFLDNGVQLGTVVAINNGQATFTTSALTAGSHPITAVYAGDANFAGSTSNVVTQVVTGALLTSITVTPNPAASIPVGTTEQFTATGVYSDGSTQNLTATATWNSSNLTAVTISNTAGTQGLATGVFNGSTNITASFNGVTSSPVTVTGGSGASPLLNASPTALLFGPQAVGATSGAQTVTLTVTPGAGAATITSISVTGDFAQLNNCGTSIPSGGSCPISVTFTPTATGSRTGQLTVSSNDPDSPFVVYLTGNSALQNLPGFMTTLLPPNDDNSTGLVPLGFTANFFGTNYTGVFVNNNGNITFDTALSTFTPFNLTSTNRVIIAPFFADVDTQGPLLGQMANLVTYGNDTVNGHQAFAVDWINVGYYGAHTDKLNTFQVVLIDRSDVGPGDFDAEFNYDKIQWETGDASGGSGGLGGSSARAGYSNGTGAPGTFFELPGSAVNGAFLDSNPSTGLIHLNSNSSVPGRILFQVRSGTVVGADLAVAMIHAPDPVAVGGNETFTTTITNNGPADASGVVFTDVLPTGVTFVSATPDQGSCSGTATISCILGSLANGASTTVTLVVTATTQGTITNTATVSASTADPNPANNTGSQTASVQPANLLPSATALASSLNPSFAGQSVTFIAVVDGPAGGTPAGNVAFWDGGVNVGVLLGTGTVSNGQATFTTSTPLTVGSHSITAVYAGNLNFLPSTSNVVTQTVNPISVPTTTPTFIALSSSPNPAAVGASVLITAVVSSSSSTGGTPTGNVTFIDNSTGTPTPIGTGSSVLTGGVATVTTSSLTAGSHPITAQYFGNTNFAASMSSVLSETIGSGTQAVSVQITPIPQNVASGTTVQFSATVSNAGTNTGVTWAQLSGPGTLNSLGEYFAPSSSSSTAVVSISATSLADSSVVTSIAFTIAADALTTSELPATVTAGGSTSPLTIQLTGLPSTGSDSTLAFTLSCSNLPVGASCIFVPPTVTGANPQFTVTVVTTGASSSHLAPLPIQPGRPWYALFALILPALAMAGRRRGLFIDRKSYACIVLVLLCVSAVFLASCTGFSPPPVVSVSAPVAKALTPSGKYQVVVTATPGANTGGFVQTQLIVPVTVN
ncbi:MAG: Ig-like domain repeat protein [Acidobacteriia bacterium]|nr:Ig-like domain repeat protein [Terriglobia bacterium]